MNRYTLLVGISAKSGVPTSGNPSDEATLGELGIKDRSEFSPI